MKVLILACLVALALAREKEEFKTAGEALESISSSEESITHINKQKIEKFKIEEQQQTEDEQQDKIYTFPQPQSLVYSHTEPIPYPILPQNFLPPLQPAVMVPFLQPKVMDVPKTKETIIPKRKEMPLLQSPVVPFTESQSLTLTDLENLHLPLPLLQSLMYQIPQPVPQTPMIPPQSLLSLSQFKVLPVPQQMVPYPQRAIPVQAVLPFQEPVPDPVRGLHPVPQPLVPVIA
ncbi:beta-casein isoform X1 [Camelus bactrianus]|uniref:Beta-casein n=4 Tax=Camelus bactrianus TaxID=9837 RepID=A0A077SL35_CAMBA|nr:beta-casein precursor [Camelus bactrianus]XP_045362078.1 beta-casein isoform X1 [Camelus bactrianus]CDO50355.1 Beta-casein [Camelus bactrianus]